MKRIGILILSMIAIIVGIIILFRDKVFGSIFSSRNPLLTTASSSADQLELISLRMKVQNEINRNIYQTVKATSDGQTVFYSTIMPPNYNINRLRIEIQNGDLVLCNNDGYTFEPSIQRLTLNLPDFDLQIDNEVRFCFL